MKKLTLFALSSLVALALTACASTTSTSASMASSSESTSSAASSSSESKEGKMVTVKSLDSQKNEIDVEVPFDPQKIAILDMASLDILDALGVADRVVGSASNDTLDYLQKYVKKEGMTKLGTVKEADMEAIAALEPDVIFIGGRLRESYDALSKIAPVVYLSVNAQEGTMNGIRKNTENIAKMFGKEEMVEELLNKFDDRIAKLAEAAKGKTAIVGMVSSGSLSVLGKDGRASLISNEIGFDNIGVENKEKTSTHGNEVSFEFINEKNPDYLFILDRDAAIATKGAKTAKEVIENDLIKKSDVYKEGHIVYLANPAAWYIAEGGITALDLMLSDIESGLLA